MSCDVSPVAMFTKGIKAKLNELESESDTFPQNERQSWQIWIDLSWWALTYSALVLFDIYKDSRCLASQLSAFCLQCYFEKIVCTYRARD